jgi:hypothetical protein
MIKLPVILVLLALFAGTAERVVAQAITRSFAKPELVRPFRVEFDQKRIDAILQRVRTAKLPRQMPPTVGASPSQQADDPSGTRAEIARPT